MGYWRRAANAVGLTRWRRTFLYSSRTRFCLQLGTNPNNSLIQIGSAPAFAKQSLRDHDFTDSFPFSRLRQNEPNVGIMTVGAALISNDAIVVAGDSQMV